MEGRPPETPNQWTSTQAYAFAAICLLVGIACGYLLHGPAKPERAAPVVAQQAAEQQAMQQAVAMPTPDQMKHMGDKMAEPVLADLQKDPNNSELLAKVASIYFRAGQFPLAVENYEKSVKIKPTAAGFVSLSNSYHYAGNDDKAFESLDRALKLDPKSPNALFNLGMLKWQVKNDPKGAIAAWEQLLKANPNHPRRAQVEGMIEKAKKHLTIAVTDKPKS
ncbi:MAG: tetratricopeptide repeat protein [Acidobacteriaceae bacterium]